MRRMQGLVPVYILVMLAFGCGFPEQGRPKTEGKIMAAKTIPFTAIYQDQGGGSDGSAGPRFSWIKSLEAWKKSGNEAIFASLPENSPYAKLAKSIDFSTQDILIFTLGDVGSTGASIRVERIESSGGKLAFHLIGKYPDPGERHGQMITHPMCVVSIAKGFDSGNLEFILNGTKTEYSVSLEK